MANKRLACLMPHPPVVVPGVGRGREADAAATVQAMRKLARTVTAWGPELLVVISPHAPRRTGALGVWGGELVRGDLERFGADWERVDLPGAPQFAAVLRERLRDLGVNTWEIDGEGLDHGAAVPLWFLVEAGWKGPTAVVGLDWGGVRMWEKLGQALRGAGAAFGGRWAVLASGDMSHRLTPDAPGGYDPEGARFDREFVRIVEGGHFRDLAALDPGLLERAGEDVVESTLAAAAACGFAARGTDVLSYEGPFGVGYTVAMLHRDPEDDGEDGPRVMAAGEGIA